MSDSLFSVLVEYGNWVLTVYKPDPDGGISIASPIKHTCFSFVQTPFCCGVQEVGKFGTGLTAEQIDSVIKHHHSFMKKSKTLQGLSIAHFVKYAGTTSFTSSDWMDGFIKAGWKQVIPDFENPVHPGNIIRQLMYVHSKTYP